MATKKVKKEVEVTKDDKLEEALQNLQKKYGNNVLMQMDQDTDFKVEWAPTGCYELDELMGHGIPKGRIIEVFGAESSGKSTLSLFLMSQFGKLS